jgi:hypothetical protein
MRKKIFKCRLGALYRSFLQYCKSLEGKSGHVWGVGTSGRREDIRKGFRRVNMMKILCTHV